MQETVQKTKTSLYEINNLPLLGEEEYKLLVFYCR